MLRKKIVMLGFTVCALSCCVYADETEQLNDKSREEILTINRQLDNTVEVDEEENMALDQETCSDPEGVVRDQDLPQEEHDVANRSGQQDDEGSLLISKTCAEGKCPSEMIERLREQKRRERGETIEKEVGFENLEIPDEGDNNLTA